MWNAPAGPAQLRFGPCRFLASRHRPLERTEVGRDLKAMRRLVRERCPPRPGVYGMFDLAGQLIYVGKAKSLRSRLLSYFLTTAEDKAARIVDRCTHLVWERLPSELAALLRELELIRRWRPAYNVQGQPGRHSVGYLCLGREPAPRAYFALAPSNRTLYSFGPVRSMLRARQAALALNDCFGLRDCPDQQPQRFADQPELFEPVDRPGCLRFELGTCLAPCVGACTRRQYYARLQAARKFLDGSDTSLLARLERDMQQAAADRQFERATRLRDLWQPLAWLDEQLRRVARAEQEYDFVLEAGAGRRPWWHVIRAGRLRALFPAPRSERTLERARQIVAALAAEPQGAEPLAQAAVGQILCLVRWFEYEGRGEGTRLEFSSAESAGLRRPLAGEVVSTRDDVSTLQGERPA